MTRSSALVLLIAAAVLFGAPAFMRDLWTPDEPRYALVAEEMLQSGDWIVLHRNGEIYREKPPLLFWTIALFSAPFGAVNEITARLPSILAALITLVLVYDLARRMFNEVAGVWSAAVLATTFRFWWQSNTGQIDMLLTACTTLSVYALWRWHESRGGRWAVAYHAGAALGLLAKGPPTFLFTLFSATGFLWGRRDERRGLRLWLGVPLSAVPVVVWFYLARGTGGGEVSSEVSGTFSRQVVGRIFSGVSHAQPPWHYLKNFPIEWFPWVFVFPWTVMYTWRMRGEGLAMRLLLSWLVPALIFFHVIVEKRAVYLLPLYPPLAILVARSLIALVAEGRRAWLIAAAAMWIVVVAGMGLSPFFIAYTPAAPGAHPIAYLLTGTAVVCVGWTFVVMRAKAWSHWPAVWMAQAVMLLLAIGIGTFPVVNANKGSKDFCAPVRALVAAGDVKVMSLRLFREEHIFYSNTRHDVVLLYPGISVLGAPDDPAVQERAREFRYALTDACALVPVVDTAAPSQETVLKLRAAVDGAIASLDLSDEKKQEYREALTHEVNAMFDTLRADTPAVLFSTSDDWRWVLAFAEDASFLTLLKDQRVSSRDMLLFANPAAVAILSNTAVAG